MADRKKSAQQCYAPQPLNYGEEVIIRLSAGGFAPLPTALIVAAHPDDEVIGAGGLIGNLKGVSFIHVTDGAPRDMTDARRAGFSTRTGYIRARKKELLSALALACVRPEQCQGIGIADQEAVLYLAEITRKIASIIRTNAPDTVLTHPYEGGHPDHDAAAFAVHAARRLIEMEGGTPPVIIEFASYHADGGKFTPMEFLTRRDGDTMTVVLSEAARSLKRIMLERFATQQKTLGAFPVEFERFRPAPLYDFRYPPHTGKLYYENFDWGITGARWRRLSKEALAALGMESPI